MTWRVEFTPAAARQIAALPSDVKRRIRSAIEEKLASDPKTHLLPLAGPLRGFGKFRVGDYRLICRREDEVLLILVVMIGQRRDIYR
jgi:mRNA interferase RelE/StbE